MPVKIKKIFGINKIGALEFFIAIYPLLAPYEYGLIKLSVVIPLLLSFCLIISKKQKVRCNTAYFKYFLIYYIIHFIVWLIILPDVPTYFTNTFITSTILLVSVMVILQYVNFVKLASAVNLVSIICFIGLLYHVVEISIGNVVYPIRVPFLPDPDKISRVYEMSHRPVSFFMEPQTYVSYMIFPLYMALQGKNMIWALLIGLSMLLSGSTTGIAMIIIIWVGFLVTQKNGIFMKILFVIAFAILVYVLFNSDYTTAGLDKMNSTNYGENSRLVNGLIIFANIPFEYFIGGIPDANISDYCNHTGLINKVFTNRDDVYVPAIWICLIQYGIIGLVLYLNIYWQSLKSNKAIIPLWLCVFVSLFTNPSFLGAEFAFIIIFLTTHSLINNQNQNEKDFNCNNAVCK